MNMVLEFDYAALIIYAVILITIVHRKLYHGRTNRLFIIMIVNSIFVTLCDFLPFVAFKFPLEEGVWVLYGATFYAYFYLRNATILMYLLFCMSSTRMWYRLQSNLMKVLFAAPYVAVFALVTSNLFHHKIFIITNAGGYSRGEWMMVLYILSGLYLLYIIFFLGYCYKRNFLESDKWFALSSLIVFTAISVVLQMVEGRYLVEMFATSLTMLCILLFVQKPEDLVDSVNGVMNYGLYQREVRKVIYTEETAQILIIHFRNAYAVREFLGEEDFDREMFRLLRSIADFFKEGSHEFDLFYEDPGYIYLVMDNLMDTIDDEELIDFTGRLLSYAVIDERKGLTLDAVVGTVTVPDDMADEESIINFGHRFVQFLPLGHHLLRASDVVGTTDFHIFNRMDEILRRAIATGAFEMYYQPIYSVRERAFVSAEALIRLCDPEYGMISPAIFIPEAERRHLMQAIGTYVLREVISFIASDDFKKLGLSYIELNLSVQQCVDKNIVADIIGYQKRFGVDPSQINLEITETDYVDDTRTMDYNLSELSDAGFALSLDDYGTGYSNMQRILRMPLKIIKIDKSMVDEMSTEKGEILVRNTIRLMQGIGMEIVAEGVEEEAQLDKLSSMGCDFIQGYYFAKPMPKNEFIRFIKDRKAG